MTRRGRATLPHPEPRHLDDGRLLVTRHVVAYLAHRDVDHVRRRVPAVACDVTTRTVLLDLDEAERLLGGRWPRDRSKMRPLDM